MWIYNKLPISKDLIHRRGVDSGEPLCPNSPKLLFVAAVGDDGVAGQWLIQETVDIFLEPLQGGFWPGRIVPNIPQVTDVLLIAGMKIRTGNDLKDKDIPGHHWQINIIDMDVKVFMKEEMMARIMSCNGGEWIPQVPTTQKKNLINVR